VYKNQTGRDVDLRRNKSHTPVSVRVVYAGGSGDRTGIVFLVYHNKNKEKHYE